MSIAIYNPYFYIIQHINSGKYYSGVKYGKNSNPDQLLKYNGYQTSSRYVKKLILEEGLESFVIRKIKIFETSEKALEYESRFLRRVNAAFNDNFLNRSNNSFSTLNVDYGKTKQTCLNNFGVEFSLQSEDVRNKSKQTMLERYGVEYPSQSKEVQEKTKQNNLEKYGVEYTSQVPEFKEKMKQTLLINYGVENAFQNEEIQEKYKQTMIEKYGCEYPLQSEEIREKSKQTCLEKYGFEYAVQVPTIKEKMKQTLLRNYGVENVSQSPEIKEKKKQTLLRNLGVEHPSQSPEVQEKKRQKFNITNNRPVVIEIRKYRDKFKLKLGNRWFWKPQEFLDNMLAELKITYGLYY